MTMADIILTKRRDRAYITAESTSGQKFLDSEFLKMEVGGTFTIEAEHAEDFKENLEMAFDLVVEIR